VLSLPALERRHCLLGHTDERGEFLLGKAAAPPDQPQDPADALLIHGEMIEADDHLVLTNDSTACGAAAIRAGGRPPPVARRPQSARPAARRPRHQGVASRCGAAAPRRACRRFAASRRSCAS
jgi:hypothetical protein